MRKIIYLSFVFLMILSGSGMNAYASSVDINDGSKDFNAFVESKVMEINNLISQSANDLEDKANIIHEEVDEYVKSLSSEDIEMNLDLMEILIDNLDAVDEKVNAEFEAENGITATSWRYGDILYYGIGNTNAVGEKSFTGHTAVLTTTNYYVVEASKTKKSGNKVFHWNRTNMWQGASGIKQYKVTSKLGKNATTTERRTAVTYGLNQVGKPYSMLTSIFASDKWYCSKLTMRMWYNAGYDLRGTRGMTIGGIIAVIPYDIIIDLNTRLHKTWGSSTPGYS
ncbi:YiiX/YebB-like N1pC/P60 family cysteine hydrolase [Sporosarcina sp. 6E9]|uniref:YiiX/YebB-like N1pC/P60 family cysteine hydrolase n=1 Tax=Sporosarcina sp. 6E9 TaxID=2819235 RepID=UPI001B30E017|nr:YiiX/YebB-like N1pC/P60 family cysteine hydrolase [Sporosarcina sp. 6E9]